MQFWLGAHHPAWLKTDDHLFVSRRALFEMKKLPLAVGRWALDSGGFTEINLFGQWRTTEEEYATDVVRFEDGWPGWGCADGLGCASRSRRLAALSGEHQMKTVENFLRLRERRAPW